ncbi:MAG: choline ABC transporter ATP-binding protein [Methylobacteriaceae bacterium]|nr:choline ABC transporter ATP-binding protein [Methylobacteriaceae bacterium]MBV9246047.1 choline ABC transporter ATP-binding protein [Methylobacteriaceae bacterium]MBV9636172.1 choline ABC transporter ATP-binding protein [Methylobacteriaceae bacterium]
MPAVAFENVDIVFGRRSREALALIDQGKTRDEILAATGAVLGAAGVNLAIEKGEICVLMGLSGSGKSTILRAVNGLNKVARGKVNVEHEGRTIDAATCSADELRMLRTSRIAMVFQQFALLPWRTVAENVGFGLELRGVPRAEIKRVVDQKLAMVGLSKWAGKFGHELSGGMQQRVGLARAFATDADILLMDEPFSALDPLIRDKLQDELLVLQKDLKKTIIFVSHDLDEALKIGNRIAILEGGRIVQCGTAEDILLTPADDYVAEFVKHMNPLNVLRGRALMTPAEALKHSDGEVHLDANGRIRVQLDPDRKPIGCTLDGQSGRLALADGETGLRPGMATEADVIVAPADLKMRSAIELRRATGNPIVLVDQLGRMAGLCGDDEIYRALLQQRAPALA